MADKKSTGFHFDIREPKKSKKIEYALIYSNNYLGEERTISIYYDLNESLQKFLRKFIKMIKREWKNPKDYFTGVMWDEYRDLIEKIYDKVNSWKDFFELIDTVADWDNLYDGDYYIDIREKGKGYNGLSEIACLKKIYSLDNLVLDKYLPFS